MNAQVQLQRILPAWESFHSATGIGSIQNEADYQRMTALLENLLEVTGDDENHPMMGLIDILGDLIEDYEARHHPLPESTGIDALRFLMEQHDLKQSDLPEVGSQGVVSEILSGKRELNMRQIRSLSQRFGVPPGTFF